MNTITFIISTKKKSNTSIGGHYYSLITYLNVLKSTFNLNVLHYNELDKTILGNYDFSGINYYTYNKRNKDYKNVVEGSSIVVMFGSFYNITKIRKICLIKKIPIISVKPGGATPKRYYPYFDGIICFSAENYNWFKTKYLYRSKSNIILLQNRIEKIEINHNRINNFKFIRKDSINILRISRINKTFYEAFHKTVNLHKELLKSGVNVNTVLIGIVEDKDVLAKLEKEIDGLDNMNILTNPEHIDNAKEFIPLFDIVTGIGRGFMEAAAERKIVLGFSKNYSIPIVIDKDNYEKFKNVNFSLRSIYSGKNEESELHKIINTINIKTNKLGNQNFLFEMFDRDYNANRIVDTFRTTEIKKNDSKYLICLDKVVSLLRQYIRTIKKSINKTNK